MVALAPAGGWIPDDPTIAQVHDQFRPMAPMVRDAAPRAHDLAARPDGRARATISYGSNADHLSADLVAHLIRGAAACDSEPLIEFAHREGRPLDPEPITCPVRFVWGSEGSILRLPGAAGSFPHQVSAGGVGRDRRCRPIARSSTTRSRRQS